MQGGAIGENAIVPMNLIGATGKADYVVTGDWSKKSIKEAKTYGRSTWPRPARRSKFTAIPTQARVEARPGAAYVHICSNETIGGVEYHWTPDTGKRAAGGRHVVRHPVAPDRRRRSTA